jgi:hypothetical protein
MAMILLRAEFGDVDWVIELERRNIRYVEQLGGLLSHSLGRIALGQLETPPPNIPSVQKKVDKTLLKHHHVSFGTPHTISPLTAFVLQPQTVHGLGLKLPAVLQRVKFGDPLPTAAALSALGPSPPPVSPSPVAQEHQGEPAPSVDLKNLLTPVRNQFFRGTCVAFTAVALLESKVLRDTHQQVDLSEQYVYYLARQNDPDKQEDGTYFQYAADGLLQRGACLESLWPYNPYNDWAQALRFVTFPYSLSDLDSDAKTHRIAGYSAFPAHAVATMKQALLNQQPVAVGVPVFRDAWMNGFTESTGEIQMPLTRSNPDGTEMLLDMVVGGHAIPLIGYRDTPDPNDVANYRPGGGYFAFKNSWGTPWASNNMADGPGFGILPYAYLEKYNTDAYVIR